jgi:hypothetical protein
MPRVIPDPGEPLDEPSDARQGPPVRREPVRPRSVPQRGVDSRQLRMVQPRPPAQPAGRVRPSRPCCFHVWYQWCAVWRLTPNAATTAACDACRAQELAIHRLSLCQAV